MCHIHGTHVPIVTLFLKSVPIVALVSQNMNQSRSFTKLLYFFLKEWIKLCKNDVKKFLFNEK